jgi:hypothetical protein
MKKAIIGLMVLLFSVNAYAGLIDISTLSDDSQVSYAYFNTAMATIKNEFNGSIESINIADSTITVDDMAASSSPAQREGDHFNSYTKSGMLPATDATLTSDISAGVSYVKSDAGLMYRISTDATSKTYTASKDTWVYIDTDGAFQYEVVATDAEQPATPSNGLLLAKVVTDADNITSVTDARTLSISLGGNDDFVINGLKLLWDGATDRFSVDAGVVYVNTTRVAKTSAVGLNVGTAGNYINGASERATDTWIHVYADTDGNIKLDDNAPDYHDASGNTTGVKHYFKNGSDYWRYIGSVRLDAVGSGNIRGFWWQGTGNDITIMLDVPVSVTTTTSNGVWSSAVDCSDGIPPTSELGIFGMYARDDDAARGVWIRPNGTTWATGEENGIYAASATPNYIAGQRICATDSSQQIQNYNDVNDDGTGIDVEGYYFSR